MKWYKTGGAPFGLLTNSGIHAHLDHLIGLLRMLPKRKYRGDVFVHAFTDGEDAPPKSAAIFLETVENPRKDLKLGKLPCHRKILGDGSQ